MDVNKAVSIIDEDFGNVFVDELISNFVRFCQSDEGVFWLLNQETLSPDLGDELVQMIVLTLQFVYFRASGH